MNALLVHLPRGFSSTDWRNNYINIMPMGLFSIANHANARGHRVRVTNLSRHGSRDRALAILFDRIEETGAAAVGFSLHWHLSALDVLWAVSAVKARFPEVFTVIGGMTASVFARELMNHEPALDAVIQGDGEIPFAALLDDLASACGSRAAVPNLWWRRDGAIVFGGIRHVATAEEYSAFDFDIAKSMFDVDEYVAGRSLFDAMAGRYETVTEPGIGERPFFVNVGRGCCHECVYCGGSRKTFARFFGRPAVCVRSPESVVRTFLDAHALGFRLFHICFDPAFNGKREYYARVMAGLRPRLGDSRFLFEVYDLPSRDFVADCAGTFAHSTLVYSPCFFDERNMRRFKGYHYTGEELQASLELCGEFPNVGPFVYWAITPLEPFDEEHLEAYVGRMRRLRDRYGCKVSAMPVMAEPGSPWLLRPADFGLSDPRFGFAAFLEEWRAPLTRWNPRLCYGMEDVNEVFAAIGRSLENAVLE